MSRRRRQTNFAFVAQNNTQAALNLGEGVGVGILGSGVGQLNDQYAVNNASVRQSNR